MEKTQQMICDDHWTNVNIDVATRILKTCCKRNKPVITLDELRSRGAMVFIDHELNQQDRNIFIDKNQIPDNCYICKDSWPNSIWHRYNAWQNRTWAPGELESMRTADVINKFEIKISNICNQTCMYCNSGSSSEWGALLGQQYDDGTEWRDALLDAICQYIGMHKATRTEGITYNMLGGEPLLFTGIYDFLDRIIYAHSCDEIRTAPCTLMMTSNLNVKPMLVKRWLDSVDRTNGWNHVLKVSWDSRGERGALIRDGADWELVEQNLDMVLANPKVSVEILPTVNLLSIPDFADLITHIRSIMTKHGVHDDYGDRWWFGVNMVVRPTAMNPALMLPQHSTHIDACLRATDGIPDQGNLRLFRKHIETLQSMIGTRNSHKDHAQMIKWYEAQGAIKRRDYFDIFPVLAEIKAHHTQSELAAR